MSLFFLRLRNAEFRSLDDGSDYENPEAALAAGVQSAARMVIDDISRGRPNAAIEVSVERDDGRRVLCSVVSVSVSPLTVNDAQEFDDAA